MVALRTWLQLRCAVPTAGGDEGSYSNGQVLPPVSLIESAHRIVEMTSDGYLEFSADMVVLDCNSHIEELVGKPLEPRLDPRSVNEVREVVKLLVAAGPNGRAARIADLWVRTRDGGSQALEGMAWVDASPDGVVLRAFVRASPEHGRVRLAADSTSLWDRLTGLPNRTMFSYQLSYALARRQADPASVAVVMVDLDRFQSVNDSFGHDVGDEVLVIVAQRLIDLARPHGTVARFGSDEFLLLIEGADGHDLVDRIAGEVFDLLALPVGTTASELFLSASLGAVIAADVDDVTRMLANAAIAVTVAKRRGGARLEVFHETMRPGRIDGSHTETSLHRALERGEFEVYYQPVVSITDRRLAGVEALVRWNHPTEGLVLPTDFIQIAEKTGLIVPIGQWVLERACADFVQWRRIAEETASIPLFDTIEVNLSARQIADPGLVDGVRSALVASGIKPSAVMLEITESALMEDPEAAMLVLRRLKNLGVRLSVDDFGTGFSSLSYLRRFPLDGLKIDRSFIVELASSPDDAVIVAMIVSLAHALGLEVIAEGVETENQLAALEATGCDQFQGFLTSHALSVSDLDAKLPGFLPGS